MNIPELSSRCVAYEAAAIAVASKPDRPLARVIDLNAERRMRRERGVASPPPRLGRTKDTLLAVVAGDHVLAWAHVGLDRRLIGTGEVIDSPLTIRELVAKLAPTYIAVRDDDQRGSFGAGVVAGAAACTSRLVDFALVELFSELDVQALAEAIAGIIALEGERVVAADY